MRKSRRFIVLLTVVLLGMAAIYAQDDSRQRITLTPSAGCYQRVFYKESKYKDMDTFGFGIGIDYAYRVLNKTEVGFGLATEGYNYPGFYGYQDVKMAVKVRQQLFSVGSAPALVFHGYAGAGTDWLFRSTGDREFYPLVLAGLGMDILPANSHEGLYLGMKLEAQGTFQGGSTVLHVLLGVEISCSLGGSK